MNGKFLRAAIGVLLTAIGIFLAACGGANEADYVKGNQAILDALPTYPGTTVVSRQDSPYHLSEQGPVSGYGTNVVYSVGADVTADDVVKFYTQQLGDSWQHCDYQIQIAAPENPGPTPAPANGNVTAVNFFRNGALVGVLTDGLSPVTRANTFEIGIDHNAPKNPCTGEKLR